MALLLPILIYLNLIYHQNALEVFLKLNNIKCYRNTSIYTFNNIGIAKKYAETTENKLLKIKANRKTNFLIASLILFLGYFFIICLLVVIK